MTKKETQKYFYDYIKKNAPEIKISRPATDKLFDVFCESIHSAVLDGYVVTLPKLGHFGTTHVRSRSVRGAYKGDTNSGIYEYPEHDIFVIRTSQTMKGEIRSRSLQGSFVPVEQLRSRAKVDKKIDKKDDTDGE